MHRWQRMLRFQWVAPLGWFGCWLAIAPQSPGADASVAAFNDTIAPFFQAHCVKCHGAKKQSGDIRLDDITPDMAKDAERWQAVRDQLRDGLMPPRKEPRPDPVKTRALVAWIVSTGNFGVERLPNQGPGTPTKLRPVMKEDGWCGDFTKSDSGMRSRHTNRR